jgi:hypothetical protein
MIAELPTIPDDDADFTPDLARKIIAKYQELLHRSSELSDDRVSREEMLEAMREQRINLGGMHDKTLAELKRVREVAAEEINRLEGEVRSLRIDNARLRDEATIRSLAQGAMQDDDPTANEQWNAGCDFALAHLCKFLGVDFKAVSWDAATETVDGDVLAVIGNILRVKFGEDWGPNDAPALTEGSR